MSESHRFKEADRVVLIAGGPVMVVEDIRDDNLVNVVWFDKLHLCHRDTFHPKALADYPKDHEPDRD